MRRNNKFGVVPCTFVLVRISGPVGYEYGAVARHLNNIGGVYLPRFYVWAVPQMYMRQSLFDENKCIDVGEVQFLEFDSQSMTQELLQAKIDKMKAEGLLPDVKESTNPFTDPDSFIREMNRTKPVNVDTARFKKRLSSVLGTPAHEKSVRDAINEVPIGQRTRQVTDKYNNHKVK